MRQASKLANTKKGDVILSRLENKHNFQRHAGAETNYQWQIEYSIDHFSLLFILARALMRPSLGCPQYY